VDEGFSAAIEWIGGGRINIAAAVGSAQSLLDLAVDYAGDREPFGKPHRPPAGGLLPDCGRSDRHRTGPPALPVRRLEGQGDRARKEESMAKLRGAQLQNEAADVATQVYGGAALMKNQHIKRQYRSARVLRIFEGTDETQKRTIDRELVRAGGCAAVTLAV
jgi:acyl-CoA dehydrogenase